MPPAKTPPGPGPTWGWSAIPWRPLRVDFQNDPLPSFLSALDGPSRGNALAAAHFTLRPVSPGRQNTGTVFVGRLRGGNVRRGAAWAAR
jgi:hypothetical protein